MELPFVERLTVKEVQEFLEEGAGVLVDTLPPEHFEARHIPGAISACVYEVGFLADMARLAPDKGTPVVFYGAGKKSVDCMVAADKLYREGYSDVAVFNGGLEEWREYGNTLEGSSPDTIDPPHPVLELGDRTYSLLPAESLIRWTGRNNNTLHYGTLGLSEGELKGGKTPVGSFVFDMSTINNESLAEDDLKPVLEAHLHSDDFFFTKLFPTATFDATTIRLVEDGEATRPNAMIQGGLSLRGVSNEIAFPAHIRNVEEGRIAILANLDFDRTQWDIIYGSSRFFQHLSYHVVFDFISVDCRLVLA